MISITGGKPKSWATCSLQLTPVSEKVAWYMLGCKLHNEHVMANGNDSSYTGYRVNGHY